MHDTGCTIIGPDMPGELACVCEWLLLVGALPLLTALLH